VLSGLLIVAAVGAVVALYALRDVLWVAIVAIALTVAAVAIARAALTTVVTEPLRPGTPVAAAHRAFIVMNPRAGGGKVARFGLKEKAEAAGAQVSMLEGAERIDVVALARRAVADGFDVLGVAGGDGTQALVAGVAADQDVPLLVISAGTRNHLALDLGLDRDDPSTCLDALTDGVEVRMDLGVIGGRPFVNNASFGAYAEVVQSPAYRDDKRGTTLQIMPDVLTGHRGARLVARFGDESVSDPQALLVSNNPYEHDDIAGLGRRARLDTGALGVIAVHARSAREAVALLRGSGGRGLTTAVTSEIVVTADAPTVPVGVDGETITLPTPVVCGIRPGALRVLLPRERPGVPSPRPFVTWRSLWRIAAGGR
jgi:diacylglycerol kinase family enzyme